MHFFLDKCYFWRLMDTCWCALRWTCEYVQMSAHVCAWYKTDEDDRCDCISAWVYVCMCVWEGWGIHVRLTEKCRTDMGAQWRLSEFHPSPHHCLHSSFPPPLLKAQTLPLVTSEYCRTAEALHSSGGECQPRLGAVLTNRVYIDTW